MIVIKAAWIRHFGSIATTIYPFILIADDKFYIDPSNLRHEKIHGRQQLEMLILPFFVWYFIEYGIRSVKTNCQQAYWRISFEREAYIHERDNGYLEKRIPYEWLKYV